MKLWVGILSPELVDLIDFSADAPVDYPFTGVGLEDFSPFCPRPDRFGVREVRLFHSRIGASHRDRTSICPWRSCKPFDSAGGRSLRDTRSSTRVEPEFTENSFSVAFSGPKTSSKAFFAGSCHSSGSSERRKREEGLIRWLGSYRRGCGSSSWCSRDPPRADVRTSSTTRVKDGRPASSLFPEDCRPALRFRGGSRRAGSRRRGWFGGQLIRRWGCQSDCEADEGLLPPGLAEEQKESPTPWTTC